ncbi:MAG TPA: adenosylmethionine--8-amino-7-oxononanoate transaminase [Dissulfurispiraceae bacterium]|nr:adenosylmethionine--8-amino-7-oxononanoate transaminase [Dissulfurispiraceae bacterium]
MTHADYIRHITAADKEFIWHPFTQMQDWLREEPLIISEGRDCFLKTTDGRWYLDGVSSLWVNIHGHRRAEIDTAVRTQLDRIAHSTLLGLGNEPSIILAEKLISLVNEQFAGLQPRLTKVFYSDNGSTAVEVALKMAFQYWIHKGQPQKQRFVGIKNGYHGDTVGAMSVGNVDIFHATFGPMFFTSFKAPSPYCYRCELDKQGPDCGMACLSSLEQLLAEHGKEVAAVILEPLVQAAGGIIVWPDGYLKGVRDLCNQYNVLLIADEVATGFGRTGKMFACEHEQIVPDIMCLSKGITNGYMPLAATLASAGIFEAFLGEFSELKTFFHGHSYTGNPLACAAAVASLDIFKSDRTLEIMREKIALVESHLEAMASLPHVGDVRSKGLMIGIELVRDKASKEPYAWEEKVGWKVAYEVRKASVLIRPLGNVVVVMPPLAINLENLAHLMSAIKQSIIAVT